MMLNLLIGMLTSTYGRVNNVIRFFFVLLIWLSPWVLHVNHSRHLIGGSFFLILFVFYFYLEFVDILLGKLNAPSELEQA